MGAQSPELIQRPSLVDMMYAALLLSCLVLSANAAISTSRPPARNGTDESCFSGGNRASEPAANNTADTFQVRVEHAGDFTDFFTIGDLYTLKKDEVLKVNASTLSVHMVCIMFHEQMADTKLCDGTTDGEVLDDERNLFVLFDGTQVCSGMEEKDIKITDPDVVPTPVSKKRNYHCVNATLEAEDMKFPYYNWILNFNGTTGNYTDTLIVKAGSGVNFASIFVVFCFSFIAKLV